MIEISLIVKYFYHIYRQLSSIIKLYTFESSGIFAYLNYLTPKSRKEILELLVVGLKRLEYRGYDSAGKISLVANIFSCIKLHMRICKETRENIKRFEVRVVKVFCYNLSFLY